MDIRSNVPMAGSTEDRNASSRPASPDQGGDARLLPGEDIFSLLFHFSPDSINLNRLRDGAYIDVNAGFERMTGWTRVEVLGRSSLPDDLSVWARAEDRAALVAQLKDRGEVADYVAQFRRKDGTLLIGSMSARIIDIAGEPCVFSITRDITGRKRVEAELEQKNAILNALVNSTEDPIFSVDRHYCYTHFNAGHARTVKRIFGHDIRIGGSSIDYLPTPEVRPLAQSSLDRALAGENTEFDFPNPGDQGERRDYVVTLNPVRAPNGEITGVAVFGRDLTDQRRLQSQLLQAQKMEAIGQLAGGVAHDFRNQLTIIIGFCDLLRESQDILPHGRSLLDQILQAARQSTDITNKLLGFSRKQILHPQLVDIAELATDTATLLPRLLREDIKFTLTVEAGPLHALLDPVQFQQAIFNLATNARDAMPHGGEFRLDCRTFVPDAAFHRRHPDAQGHRYIVVRVSDTGQGMEQATLDHVFEPFFTTKPPGQGTGLGLAMVYGFVKQCAGIIEVRSAPNAGATFTLYFREAHKEVSPVSAAPVGEGAESGGHERVLVVEDDPAVRLLLARFLASAGYAPIEAADSNIALEMLQDLSQSFGLLLTDVVMPGLTGAELAHRARMLRPRLPVLFVSGYTNAQLLARGLEALDGTYLPKPFTRAALLQAVRRALDAPHRLQPRP
jgi:PAS domain S-box-containing protein